MIDKQRILFSEVWDGVEHRANAKVWEGQSTKWHTYVQYKQTNIPDFQLCYPVSVSLASQLSASYL